MIQQRFTEIIQCQGRQTSNEQQNFKKQTNRTTKQATMYLKKDPKTEKEIIL